MRIFKQISIFEGAIEVTVKDRDLDLKSSYSTNQNNIVQKTYVIIDEFSKILKLKPEKY